MLTSSDIEMCQNIAKKEAKYAKFKDPDELLSEAYWAAVVLDLRREEVRRIPECRIGDDWEHNLRSAVWRAVKNYMRAYWRRRMDSIVEEIVAKRPKYVLDDVLDLLTNDLELHYVLNKIEGWTDEEFCKQYQMSWTTLIKLKEKIESYGKNI